MHLALHNNSLDLHLEHLNGFLKELLRNLRSNLTEENARRISQSMGNVKAIVEKTEQIKPGYRKNPLPHKAVTKLALEMKKSKLFQETMGREFPSFQEFSANVLSSLDMGKLFMWIKSRQNDFKNLIWGISMFF